ncbi:hypothetical protein GALMADRAFT_212540 [Galerina marginata CBS 339.88]|uniref:Ricin B lectin domain-containing protein n=1 Tax=Galerina marginata (strain CBS 339.88) TaxID=685588 RepID=A0A067SUH6_GALM3|nr:hypothetical protein GALMADRAFT_212540 [Galerina marginata CBS 339.88]
MIFHLIVLTLLPFFPPVFSSSLSLRAPWIPVYLACASELKTADGQSYRLVESTTFSQYYQCSYWNNDPTKGDDQFCWYDFHNHTLYHAPNVPLPGIDSNAACPTTVPHAGKYNIFPSVNSMQCVTARDIDGAPVTIEECNFSSGKHRRQTWFFDGSTLKLDGTNKCLDVTDGKTSNGVKLQVWTCVDGARNQQFYHWDHVQLIVPEDHISWIYQPGKCMDLTDGVVQDGTKIQLWDCNYQNPNQKWSVVPAVGQ